MGNPQGFPTVLISSPKTAYLAVIKKVFFFLQLRNLATVRKNFIKPNQNWENSAQPVKVLCFGLF